MMPSHLAPSVRANIDDDHRAACVASTFSKMMSDKSHIRDPARTDNETIRHVRWLMEMGKTLQEIKAETGLTLFVIKSIANDIMPIFRPTHPTRCPECNHRIEVYPCVICEVRGIVKGDL